MLSALNLSEGYTLIVVALGAAVLGGLSGLVGTLAMLKKQSLLADSVAHASLPGIVLAFILVGVKTYPVLLCGAFTVGLLAALQILYLVKKGKLKQDSSLSLMLSVYFGIGMILLSWIQHQPGTAQAGLETFLFGEAATMLIADVYLMLIVSLVVIILLFLFWKELFLTAFDQSYADSLGIPVFKVEMLFIFIMVVTVVIALRTVGVVLMSALIIAPPAAARQWSNNIKIILFLSILFGAFSGLCGSLMSSLIPKMPTGPAIIVVVSVIVAISLLFAPNRGMYWAKKRNKRKKHDLTKEELLCMLHMLSLQHSEKAYGHSYSVIEALSPAKELTINYLYELAKSGYAEENSDRWYITPLGQEHIRKIYPGRGAK